VSTDAALSFHVRRAVPGDAEAVRQVHGASIRQVCAADYSAQQIEAWASPARIEQYRFAIAQHEFHVAVSNAILIGFSELDSERGEVKAVYVAPAWLRRGVGRALLAELERVAREYRLSGLQLEASLTALPFYLAAGYRAVRRATHILSSGEGLACVEMRKEL
jgi:putative acetyltransferase